VIEKKLTLYRTSDVYFSAYLCSVDIELTCTEVDNESGGKKLVFVFKIAEHDLSCLKASYFGGSGTVKVRKYVDNLRSLKSMVYV
jgi:hypothetical protein